jgi:hypothetical protein
MQPMGLTDTEIDTILATVAHHPKYEEFVLTGSLAVRLYLFIINQIHHIHDDTCIPVNDADFLWIHGDPLIPHQDNINDFKVNDMQQLSRSATYTNGTLHFDITKVPYNTTYYTLQHHNHSIKIQCPQLILNEYNVNNYGDRKGKDSVKIFALTEIIKHVDKCGLVKDNTLMLKRKRSPNPVTDYCPKMPPMPFSLTTPPGTPTRRH